MYLVHSSSYSIVVLSNKHSTTFFKHQTAQIQIIIILTFFFKKLYFFFFFFLLYSDAPSSTASQNIYDERGMQILPETFKETSSSSSSSSSVNSNQRMNHHHQEINHTMNRNQRSSNRQSNTRTSKSALDYYMDTKRSKVQRNHPSADRAQQNSILKRKFSMLPKNRLLKYHEMERNGGQTIGQQSV